MEDNGCIFTPIPQTVAPHVLQVLEEMSCKYIEKLSSKLNFQILLNMIFSFNIKFEMIV